MTERKNLTEIMSTLEKRIKSGIQILNVETTRNHEKAKKFEILLGKISTFNMKQLKQVIKENSIIHRRGISTYRKAELFNLVEESLKGALKYVPMTLERIDDLRNALLNSENKEIIRTLLEMKLSVDHSYKETGETVETIDPVEYSGNWTGADLVEKLSPYLGKVVILYGGSLSPQFGSIRFAFLEEVHEIKDDESQFKAQARVKTLEIQKYIAGISFPDGIPILTRRDPYVWSWKLSLLPSCFYNNGG